MYPPRKFPPRRQNRRENVNESIRAREVRAVFPDDDRDHAYRRGVAPRARTWPRPGADRATAFPRWRKRSITVTTNTNRRRSNTTKEETARRAGERAKFRPNTDDHDYDFKKNHAIRFLQEGNRVKAVVQFRGREIAHADLGKKLLIRFAGDLTTYGAVEGSPRLEGRNAHILISPIKAAVKARKSLRAKSRRRGTASREGPCGPGGRTAGDTAVKGEKAPQSDTTPAPKLSPCITPSSALRRIRST